jgi:GNAT superfamily N-acetyltransferase
MTVQNPPSQPGRLTAGDLGHRPVVRRPPDGGKASAAVLRALHRHQFRGRTRRQVGWLVGFLAGFISQFRPGEAYIHFVGVDPAARGGGLGRLLYEAFFWAAEARGCILVRAVTSPVNRGSVAFHQRMGFQLEPGDTEADGIPVSSGYDGPGSDRVRSFGSCAALDLLPTPSTPGGRYRGQVIARNVHSGAAER